jgi:hypothetical protein
MNERNFTLYVEVLQQKPFVLYPAIEVSATQAADWYDKKFAYISNSETHVTIEDIQSHKSYLIPLALVEFANPGVLRLTRAVKPWNGGFV